LKVRRRKNSGGKRMKKTQKKLIKINSKQLMLKRVWFTLFFNNAHKRTFEKVLFLRHLFKLQLAKMLI